MEPPSLSNELILSLGELSFGVKNSHILTTGPVVGTSGAPPMAKIELSDGAELVVKVTEKGWQICDPTTQTPSQTRYETLDDLLNANNTTYASLRQELLMQKLLAVAVERDSADVPSDDEAR